MPVLCIGETEAENEAGKTEEVCARQIDAVINALGVEAFNGAVIAYEPIWAIGTVNQQLQHKHKLFTPFIRGHIAAKSQAVADQVIIQYGGSVNDANAAELFTQPDIDGALVGGASPKAPAFAVIVKAAAAAKTNFLAQKIKSAVNFNRTFVLINVDCVPINQHTSQRWSGLKVPQAENLVFHLKKPGF